MCQEERFKFCLDTRSNGALPLDPACLESGLPWALKCSVTGQSTLISSFWADKSASLLIQQHQGIIKNGMEKKMHWDISMRPYYSYTGSWDSTLLHVWTVVCAIAETLQWEALLRATLLRPRTLACIFYVQNPLSYSPESWTRWMCRQP